MIYFAELMDPARLNALLDDRLAQLRETMNHIAQIESSWDEATPGGARFVAGFGALLARVAADYIENNRHMLAPAASASPPPRSGRAPQPHDLSESHV
jgi:hypothetical protein